VLILFIFETKELILYFKLISIHKEAKEKIRKFEIDTSEQMLVKIKNCEQVT